MTMKAYIGRQTVELKSNMNADKMIMLPEKQVERNLLSALLSERDATNIQASFAEKMPNLCDKYLIRRETLVGKKQFSQWSPRSEWIVMGVKLASAILSHQ